MSNQCYFTMLKAMSHIKYCHINCFFCLFLLIFDTIVPSIQCPLKQGVMFLSFANSKRQIRSANKLSETATAYCY